jgi:predicted neutral ceramidase superfamily lipid hydrolase
VLGWNYFFNTKAEQVLWRVSAISVSIVPVPLVAMLSPMRRKLGEGAKTVLALGLVLGVMFYVVVRVYLVAECLAGLRRVPSGVYQTIHWSEFIPHVSG